jgi:hypothetical protein
VINGLKAQMQRLAEQAKEDTAWEARRRALQEQDAREQAEEVRRQALAHQAGQEQLRREQEEAQRLAQAAAEPGHTRGEQGDLFLAELRALEQARQQAQAQGLPEDEARAALAQARQQAQQHLAQGVAAGGQGLKEAGEEGTRAGRALRGLGQAAALLFRGFQYVNDQRRAIEARVAPFLQAASPLHAGTLAGSRQLLLGAIGSNFTGFSDAVSNSFQQWARTFNELPKGVREGANTAGRVVGDMVSFGWLNRVLHLQNPLNFGGTDEQRRTLLRDQFPLMPSAATSFEGARERIQDIALNMSPLQMANFQQQAANAFGPGSQQEVTQLLQRIDQGIQTLSRSMPAWRAGPF